MSSLSRGDNGSAAGTKVLAGLRALSGTPVGYAAFSAGIALLYFACAKLGLRLALFHPSATPVWPPTGIAFAVLLLFGPRMAPCLLLGAFAANFTTWGNIVTSLVISAGNVSEGLLGAWLVQRFAGGDRVFERATTIFLFAFLSALVAASVSATTGVATLTLSGYAAPQSIGPVWLTWWLGDAVGDLLVAPVIVLFLTGDPRPRAGRRTPGAILEGAAIAASIVVLAWLLVGVPAPIAAPLKFFCIPPLLWAAFRFGRREAAAASLLLAIVAIAATIEALRSHGITTGRQINEALLLLQSFLGMSGITTLAVSAVVADRRRLTEELEADSRFRALLESAPDAMVVVDRNGTIVMVNAQTELLTWYAREELIGQPVEILVPDRFQPGHPGHRENFFSRPSVRPMGGGLELRVRRHDGTEFAAEISLSPLETSTGLLVTAAIRDITERSRAQEKERTYREQLRALSARLESLREVERIALSREIHDRLGQSLTGLKMDLLWIERRLGAGGAPPADNAVLERAVEAIELVDAILDAVRRISRELRPEALDNLGLDEALGSEARRFQERTGITCDFSHSDGASRIHPHAQTAFFRIFQECLSNVARHADASKVTSELTVEDREARLVVRDNGRGITEEEIVSAHALGMLSMRERASLLGGEVLVRRGADGGTEVIARIPESPA